MKHSLVLLSLAALALPPAAQAPDRAATAARGPHSAQGPWSVRLAVIGDYGLAGPEAESVAQLVQSLVPDLVLTVGGNNHPAGESTTIDTNIGQYWSDWIFPYLGSFGPGGTVNRFYPALGNRDWETAGATPFLDYFTLPGNERYYAVPDQHLELFFVSSDVNEPDGHTAGSVQGQWLQTALAASTARHRIVLLHHSPYGSSAMHGPVPSAQWPFAAWGATAVLSGHDHVYERLDRNGIPHLVNGLGGVPTLHDFEDRPVAGSQARFARGHGAVIVDLDEETARTSFVRHDGVVLDRHLEFADDPAAGPEVFVPRASTWRYWDQGTLPAADWNQPGFDDAAWPAGPAELGYGDGDEATVVDFGPDPLNKHVTTYFRHAFTLTDPGSVTELYLDLLRDDGAIVWLNGSQLLRDNVPAGPVGNDTLAPKTQDAPRENSTYRFLRATNLLVTGTNVLAVEVHQSEVDSSDKSFALELWGHRDSEVLLPRGSAWRYLDAGRVAPAGWEQPGFDDASWALGNAPLGYGEGDEATVITGAPAPAAGPPASSVRNATTTWFRTTFDVADAPLVRDLELQVVRDDGLVVHLNGVEIWRYGLTDGPVGPTTRAGVDVPPAEERSVFGARIDHRLLVDGTNTLAVELHQAHPRSPDARFDLGLIARP